jgi:hypothetical protein
MNRLRAAVLGLSVLALVLALADTTAAQWSFAGPGTPCASGVTMRLTGIGTMAAGTTNTLELTDGIPDEDCFLVVGVVFLGAPFKGGVLGPDPLIIQEISLDAAGMWVVGFTLPAAFPVGLDTWYQAWCPDGGVPSGWCSSNTLKSTSS